MQQTARRRCNTCLLYLTQSVRWTLATDTERRVSACRGWGGGWTFKGANPRIWYAHTWSYISGKPSFKKTHAPHVHVSSTYRSQETEPSKCPLTGKNLKKKWYMYTTDYYLALKSHHWNYEIMPKVTTRMNLGGSYTKWSYWDRGRQKNMISLQAKFLKHMKENHLKLKKTFPGNSNTN